MVPMWWKGPNPGGGPRGGATWAPGGGAMGGPGPGSGLGAGTGFGNQQGQQPSPLASMFQPGQLGGGAGAMGGGALGGTGPGSGLGMSSGYFGAQNQGQPQVPGLLGGMSTRSGPPDLNDYWRPLVPGEASLRKRFR